MRPSIDEPESGRSADTGQRQVVLAEVLDAAARELLSHDGVEHTLELIVAGALQAVPYVDRAGISLVERDGTVRSHAPSDEVVGELDRLQNELAEGPCRDSIHREERVLVPDMAAAAQRWPRFAPAAAARGVGTLCAFQLFAQDRSAGALNLYSGTPHVFDETSLEIGSLFASHAAVALHGAHRAAGLTEALRNRDVIGQAKGILIERFHLSEEQAFAMLVRSSQDTQLKLYAVAEWLVTEATRGHRGTA